MQLIRVAVLSILAVLAGMRPGLAETLMVFSGDVPVNLDEGLQAVPVPVQVTASELDEDTLVLGVSVTMTPLYPPATLALRAALGDVKRSCENRVKGKRAEVKPGAGEIVLRADLNYERWLCEKVLGQSIKTRVLRESGTVVAGVTPYVRDGRLQLRLSSFRLTGLSEISRFLNLDKEVRKSLQKALDTLNRDDDFALLPAIFGQEGFAYSEASLSEDGILLRGDITGPDSAMAVLRILASLQGDTP